ncbi:MULTISPECIES: tyrosine-protein phosphatase [Streptomyces]|uniref:Protein-tyrosine phosphatase n=1 Tax=Streptomyces clavifer TaxID=68188 RepID=A0ABS4VH70_9ACTN|nr:MULTISPECIES: tyrosine-protein phosphatase [Streptomyces]KQX91575.1 protein tyrosine phosphatase [Streptomyces sp. Root1319]MBP2363161.1 protein-tyrosine phosphatase [Streptomyces clavifer]MDX2743126.1 tyrosine-protein phosphatase [Streptomyces sp. NRRL_B-2557]MDX3061166.1 tyrosine-protein phosphatase [Streptomyces sp. ND04-05B]RPK72499.1 Tyrosine-protein phosphatase precursor [Streptomyces sp. ADI97-07]
MQTARAVPAATVVNLRDLGGIALGRGRRLRQGILLRSGQLSGYDPEHDTGVAALGIRTVVDLRTADERTWAPDRLPTGARLFVADVLGDNPGVSPARLRALLGDPDGATAALGGGRAEELFAQTYRKMVLAPGAAAAFRALMETVADPRARPLLFHCATGKGRTGWATALLLLVAGAPRDVVRAEFLAVNRAVRAALEPLVRRFLDEGGDPDIASAVVDARPRYLEAALDAMDERWGGLDGYLRDGLRLPPAVVERLRDDLAVPV